jgi:putative spermidine/putrescine transport system substrate-binding protein
MTIASSFRPRRRDFLLGAAALLSAPAALTRGAQAAQQLMVRSPGGVYDDVKRKVVYEPFQKETGIEVVPVPATAARLLAMAKSGRIDIDCVDAGADAVVQLQLEGVLTPINFKAFKYTNPDDIDPAGRGTHHVALHILAFVLTYNKDVFPTGKEPKSWGEFWDTKAFPGARTLPGMASGNPNLEFALLADGVPPDQIYPIDIARAFKSMSRIKPSIPKFWETGALSAQMMADREVVLGSLWNSRVQPAIATGTPLGIQWNQNLMMQQAIGIFKGSEKQEAALTFIDYSLSPETQSRWAPAYQAIPSNMKAYPDTPGTLIDPDTRTPWTKSKGINLDNKWWAQNRTKVSEAWSNWVL